jgi:hypothetical protein
VLATRPTVGRSNLIARNSGHKKGELLFFGNFYKMKLEEYKAEINMLISERDFLYESLIEDIYRMGEILAKKYKLLRFAYSIFMIGFVLSVLAFSVAIILFR